MDKHNEPANENWLDSVLGKQNMPKEIGPDEQAVNAAGLTHPDDLELERIVQETLAEDWSETPAENENRGSTEQTRFFAPQQEPVQEVNVPEEPDAEEEPPVETDKKNAKKSKKGYGLWGIPHILATVVWVALIVFIGTSLGRTLWLCAADLLALGKEGQEITITVNEKDDIGTVADKLEEVGMIRYPSLFKAFADLTGKGEKLLVGDITFNKDIVYDYNALINALAYRSSALVTVEVLIPEGYSCAQIFELLEKEGVCDAADLERHAAEGELKEYWFLEGVDRGHKYCLEGFLFPDTYEFYLDDEPQRVLEKFLDDFDYRFSQRMMDKYTALRQSTGLDLSLYEVIIMASIIEKEKAVDLEGYTISSVYYNRLMNASSFPFLNSDATILYATDYYNKGELTTDELINASPYNTYTQKGLPPTPIANPGLSSLDAALDPEDTNYFYYVLNKETNRHVFARTYEEHQANLNRLGY